MEITQEQAKIIHEWFSKLLAVDPSKIRGSDFNLAYIIKDAAEQSVHLTNVCRVINHFYVEGVCSQCGSKEPPRG